MQVALVGEAGGRGGRRDRLAGFEQAARSAYAVGELERMRRQAGVLADQANQAELADAGRGSELVQADVALGPVCEVVAGAPDRRAVPGAQARADPAHAR